MNHSTPQYLGTRASNTRPFLLTAALAVATLPACSDDVSSPFGPPAGADQPVTTSVQVSPEALHLSAPGASDQLTAEVRDAQGDPVHGASLSWTSTKPGLVTVDQDGLVSAVGTGQALVIASFGNASDSSYVYVGSDNPPPPPSGSLHPNEPAGFNPVSERSFASREENGWRTTSSSHFSITQDPGAPAAGPSVGQVRFPAGWTGGSAPTWSEHSIAGHGATSLYISFRLKISDNWQGHPVNDKLAYFFTHGKPVAFPAYVGGGSSPLSTEIRIQDVPDGSRNFRPNLGDLTIQRGEWHHWEIRLVSNTGNDANGEIHWWVDGVKLGAHHDVRFGTSSQSKVWGQISWRPVWGGQGSQVQQDMFMWMDHFYASGGS